MMAFATRFACLSDCFAWTPYGNPTAEDIEHVYRELTVPTAPFCGRVPAPSDSRPHALVLIGDQPHEPGHLEEGLRPVFDATGVIPHFTVDVNALSAQNLAKVRAPGDPARWPDATRARRSHAFHLDEARARAGSGGVCRGRRGVPQPAQCDGTVSRQWAIPSLGGRPVRRPWAPGTVSGRSRRLSSSGHPWRRLFLRRR